ncbi:hypothetical protein A6A06_03860 [Streptomyces sp. CB02923]|nr:hypothetical protein [Streptomyces sp. CB02923]OKI09788.1 hypothetical protein A6A06_03860 [Streptomyces sp. CB02923]
MMSATSTLAVTHFVTLADSFDKDKVTPGVLGFIVFAVIGGAVWLLMKSMNKQMKKVDFEETPEAPAASGGTEAAKGRAKSQAKGQPSGKAQPKAG